MSICRVNLLCTVRGYRSRCFQVIPGSTIKEDRSYGSTDHLFGLTAKTHNGNFALHRRFQLRFVILAFPRSATLSVCKLRSEDDVKTLHSGLLGQESANILDKAMRSKKASNDHHLRIYPNGHKWLTIKTRSQNERTSGIRGRKKPTFNTVQ